MELNKRLSTELFRTLPYADTEVISSAGCPRARKGNGLVEQD